MESGVTAATETETRRQKTKIIFFMELLRERLCKLVTAAITTLGLGIVVATGAKIHATADS